MFKKRPKTLAELDEEGELLDAELSVAQKRATIKQLEAKVGKGGWRR